MKHLFKSVKSAIAFLLAAAFLCGGMTALTHTQSSSTVTEKICSQGLSSNILLADDWDCSNFI